MGRHLSAAARAKRSRFAFLSLERLEDRSLLAQVGYQVHLLPVGGSISGPELTGVSVGQTYDLAVSVSDLRANPGPTPGVFAGYLDIGYDSSKTRVQVGEIQKIKIGPFSSGNPASSASGMFTLSSNGHVSWPITYSPNPNALAASLETAIAGLQGIGVGNVKVNVDVTSGSNEMMFQIRYGANLIDKNVANLRVSSQSLTGPSQPSVAITYDGNPGGETGAYAFKEAFRSIAGLFPNGLSAGSAANLLDELGAFAGETATGTGAKELVRARMVATAAGAVVFTPSLANLLTPAHDTLLFGQTGAVPASEIDLGASKTLTIGTAPIISLPDVVTILTTATPLGIDVLANDVTNPPTLAKSLVSVTTPGHGTANIAGNAKIIYIPAVGFTGTDTFSYTATADGQNSTATVTVLVTAPTMPLMRYQVRVVEPSGTLFMRDPQETNSLIATPDLTTVNIGDEYDVVITVDAGSATPLGVFAGYLDLGYDAAKTKVQLKETQLVTIGPFTSANNANSATGTFTLNFGGQVTDPIAYSPSSSLGSRINTALSALPGVGTGHIGVTGGGNIGDNQVRWRVAFGGKYLGQDVPNMTVDAQGLSGPTNPSVAVTYEGDLQGGAMPATSVHEAFRPRGLSTITGITDSTIFFNNGVSASALPNLIDELGAFTNLTDGTNVLTTAEKAAGLTVAPPRELVRGRFKPTANGTVTFTPDVINVSRPFHDSLLYSVNGPLSTANLDTGTLKTLTISGPAPIVTVNDTATLEQDSGPKSIDVLANDATAPATEQTKNLVSITQPTGGTVQFTTTTLTYTPNPGFTGTDTFTYTARNITAGESSATSTATVTVTVTATAAPEVKYQIRVIPVGGALFMPDPQNPGKLIPTPDLTSVRTGQEYDVAVTVQTEPGQLGVFAGYLDIGYNSQLTKVQVGEVQQLRLAGTTGGTFKLTFGTETTESIAYSGNWTSLAGLIEQRLATLPAIGAGNVQVDARRVNSSTVDFVIRFTGKFYNQNATNLVVTTPELIGEGAAITLSFDGDLASGSSDVAFREAFRSRGTQLITTVPSDRAYYTNGLAAGNGASLVNDVGAFSTLEGPYPGQLTMSELAAGILAAPPRELVRARFVATAAGNITFAPDVASLVRPQYNTLLYGLNAPVPVDRINAGTSKSLAVCECVVTAQPDSASVLEDAAEGVSIEVLANDSILPGTVQILTVGQTVGGTATKVSNSLLFKPAENFVGTASVTYLLQDGTPGAATAAGSSATGTVTITVTPVNDAPSFQLGDNVETTDESGSQTAAQFAKQVSVGPSDESNQAFEFLVSTDKPELFAATPKIDVTGALTYTPAPNAHGLATVSVRLKDSGLRENGGVDESQLKSFTINVVKINRLHNTAMPLDTSGDGGITSVDALNCINYINAFGSGKVPEGEAPKTTYVDVNGDGFISAADPLDIINFINAFGAKQPSATGSGSGGEGEAAGPGNDLIAILAADAAEQALSRRRKS